MSERLLCGCLAGMLACGLAAGLAFADDRMSSTSGQNDDQVARLEALLEAQQRQIETLEQQVGTAQSKNQDAARVEEMKRQIREVLSEHEFRESLMPSMMQAGYDNGFFIKDSADKFKLQINGRMQLRWTHYGTRATNRWWQTPQGGNQRNDRTGFEMQRIWVVFSGHAYTPDLTYNITMDGGAPYEYRFAPFYAWFNYRFRDEFQFRGGLMRIQSTRQQVLNDAWGAFPDRNMVDAVFGLGLGLGTEFWGYLFDKQLEYHVQVLNALNGPYNRVITPDTNSPTGTEIDANPALVFRTVWHALGEGGGKDFRNHADLEFHESPALDLGFHYAFNEDEGDRTTSAAPYPRPITFGDGGFGLTNTNGLQVNQWGLDAHFKWQGFHAMAEYMLRLLDVRQAASAPFSRWFLLTGDDSTVAQHGAYLQLGYFLPIPGMEKKLEAVARVGGISALAGRQEGTWEYAGGFNYYFEGNKVKLQTDVTKIIEAPTVSNYSSMANVNDDILMWRVQLQVEF